MQLFFHPQISDSDSTFTFSKEESRHIVKVLRKTIGDVIYITNGQGERFEGEIIEADLKKCTVSIESVKHAPKKGYRLHLAVAPTKMNDRFEWFLEKATEIGVDTITPILCDRSERKVIKTERMEKIVQSAMKQSLQSYLPQFNEMTSLNDFVSQNQDGSLFIAHCDDGPRSSLKSKIIPGSDVTILIGPEGDFSVKEIEMALAHNYIPVTLGKTRLRTETAAIVACQTVALMNE